MASETEAITKVGFRLFRPRVEFFGAARKGWRRSKGPSLFDNLLRALGRNEAGEERCRQEQEYEQGKVSAGSGEHSQASISAMSGTEAQANNVAIKFKTKLGKRVRKAHQRGLISEKALASLKQKERENDSSR
jgi:hypothetical protein